MIHAAPVIILLPLVGFFVLTFGGRRLGDPSAGWLGTLAVAGSFVASIVTFLGLHSLAPHARSVVQTYYTWVPVGGLKDNVSALLDPLSLAMVLFVTGVSSLIHLYSISYMKGDPQFRKFFVYLNLFVLSMIVLVMAGNFLFTFVGWEGVGTCSYLLIGFWFDRETAATAAKKAFVVNRIGDFGFLLAMFLIFAHTGSLDYHGVFAHLGSVSKGTATAIALLLLFGAVGKSAQLPLYVWLPDAMEGPTPVSALIHAATMVTAGVYLLCRINPLLHASGAAALTVAIVGGVTAFVAATIACAQQDIKKVQAYSTVSQLGYMFLAIGCGAYEAAIFLMVAHAFFKGLLFLGAGSAIHGLHDEQDLKRMGNLRHYMPLTFITFGIGWLAIAAVPPLSGFWAKGDVLENTWAAHPALWALGLVTAALTAYYMSRLTGLAFFGRDRWSAEVPIDATTDMPGAHHSTGHVTEPHESPRIMVLPLWILAFLAAFAGVMALSNNHVSLAHWIDPVFGSNLFDDHLSTGALWTLGITDALVAVIGVTAGLLLWRGVAERPRLEGSFLRNSWYVNELYDAVFGRPAQRLAEFGATVIDPEVIDGGVNGVGTLVRRSGALIRRTQTGYVRNYVLGIVVGTVLVLAFVLTRMWWG